MCHSGLEILWRKATGKVKRRHTLLIYLVVVFPHRRHRLRVNDFEEATLGRYNFRWRNICSQRVSGESRWWDEDRWNLKINPVEVICFIEKKIGTLMREKVQWFTQDDII